MINTSILYQSTQTASTGAFPVSREALREMFSVLSLRYRHHNGNSKRNKGKYNHTALEAPNKLILSTTKLNLLKGSSYSFTVKGVDNNGYSSYINFADINWTVNEI